MSLLSLDIGTRRTGAAVVSDATGFPMPLDTIQHVSVDELMDAVLRIVEARSITEIVVGLPLLPNGTEGKQSQFVRSVIARLEAKSITVHTVDERYSTPQTHGEYDADSASACAIADMYLSRLQRGQKSNDLV